MGEGRNGKGLCEGGKSEEREREMEKLSVGVKEE